MSVIVKVGTTTGHTSSTIGRVRLWVWYVRVGRGIVEVLLKTRGVWRLRLRVVSNLLLLFDCLQLLLLSLSDPGLLPRSLLSLLLDGYSVVFILLDNLL